MSHTLLCISHTYHLCVLLCRCVCVCRLERINAGVESEEVGPLEATIKALQREIDHKV